MWVNSLKITGHGLGDKEKKNNFAKTNKGSGSEIH
jgi:hypothetical protein